MLWEYLCIDKMADGEIENEFEVDLLDIKLLKKERLKELVEILSNESTSLSKQNAIMKILINYSIVGLFNVYHLFD
jgi:hypothetical protein